MTDFPLIAGLDEVGRGALAGPVVAAACILKTTLTKLRMTPPRWKPRGMRGMDILLADSKLLSPDSRSRACIWIRENCACGVGMCSAEEIDRHGILWATNRAMTLAVEQLCVSVSPTLLLVDGRDKFLFPFPHKSIIRGDQTEPAIAAASILAKVTRDALLTEHEATYAGFRFSRHKGYGTAEHLRELQTHGPTVFHRQTFIRNALSNPQTTSF